MPNSIRRMFSEVAHRYELVNKVITMCMDGYWRKLAAKVACASGASAVLDLCSGTGDMALAIAQTASCKPTIVAVDFCPQMAMKASLKLRDVGGIVIVADVKALPFADSSFDAITVSFGVRNIFTGYKAFIQCLKEMKRVLSDGGKLVLLETSQPKWRIVRRLFHCYVRSVVRHLGGWLSGSKKAYRYLSETIERFIDADELSSVLMEAGFHNVAVIPLLFGIITIHVAIK
ncbi:MAG: ubiquinone/menaquinone biosynthesis methyltransferase [Armatimonadota bacterium]|nr:ubiquinone/menaquinone biosynthesis methyltransferase [Armatimonadota bacterium]MCX7777518.1 ubiquinone/menaquinone biosynthesis methyltransferase [Armatimonadota bacterium]MDW8025994.1 ubiquinone/menaquinone biosynthesis methyltransferase [Armatimonadota bacterium]